MESGIQTEHRGDGLFLLQDVWEDSMAESWDHGGSITHMSGDRCWLSAETSAEAVTKAPTFGFSMWPGLSHSMA